MGIFWVSQKHKNKCNASKNTKALITNKITKKALQIGGFSWFLQESNQGHTDFQSVALPTELKKPLLIFQHRKSIIFLNKSQILF